jgi:hypothetical protein
LVVDVPEEYASRVIDWQLREKVFTSWKPKEKCSTWNSKFLQEV